MRLKQLVLRNYGLYRGEQVLDLAPRSKRGAAKPIVLVGGHNGAGKTTVLEAVRLCLYGRMALGARVTESEYQTYLKERIHKNRDALLPLSYASVSLEFDYAHAGNSSTYYVQRAWEVRGSGTVSEGLRVLRNGEPLADVDAQFFPEFIRNLIPLGVSQLFFFDGEKIKRLAEADSENETLAESVKALLGLDLVEKLKADLDLYESRFVKKTATGMFATMLSGLEGDASKAALRVQTTKQEESELIQKRDVLAKRIDETELALSMRGEGMAAKRGELRQQKAELETRIERLQKELRELCDGVLPFSLCPALSKALVVQLKAEAQRNTWETSRAAIDEVLAAVAKRLTQGHTAEEISLTKASKAVIRREIDSIRKDANEIPANLAAVKPVHQVSEASRDGTLRIIDEALHAAPFRAAQLSKDLDRAASDLRVVQGHLSKAPEADEISPLVKALSQHQEEQARVALSLKLKTEEREVAEKSLTTIQRELDRAVKSQKEAGALANRLVLSRMARRALDTYLARLTKEKTEELRKAALESFQTLCRKSDLVHDFQIDPTTFEVTLFDAASRVLPKSSLSAGEKQIYAISLLWGLAKVSGRPLPMIIDTPLGRLDSIHRKHLLERYFPHAAHQVIILSTDTEIDQTFFDQLKRHTSHSVHLVNHSDGWTEVAPGYFWEEATSVGITA